MAGWGQGFFEGAGTLAGSIGEGLLAAMRPDDPRRRNPTGLTPEQFAALQAGTPATPPQRPGLGESLLAMSPLGAAKDAWDASSTAGEGGYEGGRATATALGNLAMLMVPGSKALKAEARAPIRAYHGSPHSFDRFDASKIGTGEGAQAYGYGHYFAEAENVAKSYRDELGRGGFHIDSQPVVSGLPASEAIYAMKGLTREAKDQAAWHINRGYTLDDALQHLDKRSPRDAASLRRAIDSGRIQPTDLGKMYEVGIHADPARFLDWDKPLSAQGEPVTSALQTILKDRDRAPGDWIRSSPGAEGRLSEAGIPGIRYLDAGSRAKGAGSSNYVVFPGNEHLIEILRKYGLLPAAALPAAAVPGLLSQPGEQ